MVAAGAEKQKARVSGRLLESLLFPKETRVITQKKREATGEEDPAAARTAHFYFFLAGAALSPSGTTSHLARLSTKSVQSVPASHLVRCCFLPVKAK